jgi:membrane protease YdiL (CAAX protease family)
VVIVGMVIAMTLAGMVFCWLRIRSKSLVAPFLFHWGVNATAFFLAWLVSRS